MKVPAGQTVEECIRDDVHDLMVKTGRVPKLAYMVNPVDASAMLARLPFVGGSQIDDGKPTWFEMHTEAGYVRIVVDPNHPTGATHRFVICKCGALSLYMPGVEQCLNCLTLKPRPYAPGEKMTDRHPDSAIARVVDETLAVDPTLRPVQPCGIGSTHHTHRCERPAGHAGVHVGRGCSWGEDAVDKLPGGGSSTFSGPYRIGEDEMQAETPRVVTTCPGWNGVFTIDPDPPDLAQRQAARVAEHQRREQERGPFDYEVPSYDGILKAPYEQPGRPDGFDQRAVDAAKAALLSPAPPRYPRTR